MNTYEFWAAQDGTQTSFFPSDTKQRELNTHDVDGRPMIHLYSLRARNWDMAIAAMQKIRGY